MKRLPITKYHISSMFILCYKTKPALKNTNELFININIICNKYIQILSYVGLTVRAKFDTFV